MGVGESCLCQFRNRRSQSGNQTSFMDGEFDKNTTLKTGEDSNLTVRPADHY